VFHYRVRISCLLYIISYIRKLFQLGKKNLINLIKVKTCRIKSIMGIE